MRASWRDAADELARMQQTDDPLPDQPRDGIEPGRWPGYPSDRMPPNCPVVPLGMNGTTSYVVDTLGQLIAVKAGEWSKKMLQQLFSKTPYYLYWAWPRWNAKTLTINGLETDDAMQCILKACADRGLFEPMDKVRGRGAWRTSQDEMLWHAGDVIYRLDGRRLQSAKAGEVDNVFYPQRPPIMRPWPEPCLDDNPARDVLSVLRSWNWERKQLDPLLVLGWIGAALVGGALAWRPTLFVVGDKGVGKSTLQALVRGILGSALHSAADTTPAGIYQRVRQDSLPVAIDELEATADNRRVMGVVALARLASSGAMMFRGGAEHEGVEFRLQNSFFFSAINNPPLEPAERSRMAFCSLGKLDPDKKAKSLTIDADSAGRMMLRALMDGWKDLDKMIAQWRDALSAQGMDSRAQDTYGTLLAIAHLLLGDEAMEKAGLGVENIFDAGHKIARWTSNDRAEASENWRLCLEHILDCTIEAWKGGEKPTVGNTIASWESGEFSTKAANERLNLIGLAARGEDREGAIVREEDLRPSRHLLAVPLSSVQLGRLFAGTKWSGGVWGSALKQAPADVVIRDRGNGQNMKINRKSARCLYVDLRAYDAKVKEEEG